MDEIDYGRLSKETLIHEVIKLKKDLEIEKMCTRNDAFDADQVLNAIEYPIYMVGINYEIMWANDFTLKKYEGYQHLKCYQVFFNRSDICPNCHLNPIIKMGQINKIQVVNKGDTIQIIQMPFVQLQDKKGVLEYHYQVADGLTEKEKLKLLLRDATMLNDSLKKSLERERNFTKELIQVIRTPLRALNGFFQIDPQNRPDYLETLKNTAHQLYELINKLTFSEMKEISQYSKEVSPMNFKKILDLALKQAKLGSYYKSLNQQFNVQVAPSLPEIVKGDPMRTQILLTYLFEWILFSGACKQIRGEVTDINQTLDCVHIGVVLKSYDNDADEFSLSPLERYSAKIGMEVVQKMADALDFRLEHKESARGELTIELIMRFDKVVSVNEPIEKASKEDAARKRILIADMDKPDIGMDFFEDYEVYFAKTGQEAIDMYFRIEPEVTLLNVALENCDGFEVFDEIQKNRVKYKPIIAISQQLIDGEEIFMKNYGFDDYYPKPIDAKSIKEIIERYL